MSLLAGAVGGAAGRWRPQSLEVAPSRLRPSRCQPPVSVRVQLNVTGNEGVCRGGGGGGGYWPPTLLSSERLQTNGGSGGSCVWPWAGHAGPKADATSAGWRSMQVSGTQLGLLLLPRSPRPKVWAGGGWAG